MNSDTAYWVLSTIAQATAAIVGLVIVAAIFYRSKMAEFHQGTIWMYDYEYIVGRFHRIARYWEYGGFISLMGLSLFYGFAIMINSVDTLASLPGGQTPLGLDVSKQVAGVQNDFQSLLLFIGVLVFIWVGTDIFWQTSLRRFNLQKPGIERIARRIPIILRNAAWGAAISRITGEDNDKVLERLEKKEDVTRILDDIISSFTIADLERMEKEISADLGKPDSELVKRFLELVNRQFEIEFPERTPEDSRKLNRIRSSWLVSEFEKDLKGFGREARAHEKK